MEFIKFNEHRPKDGQRCLVMDKYEKRVRILTFNAYDECWDDEEADDYLCDIDRIDLWQPLPIYYEMEDMK